MNWWLWSWAFPRGRADVPLRDYLDQRFEDQMTLLRLSHEHTQEHFMVLERAREIALTVSDTRIGEVGKRIDSLDSRVQGVEQGKLGIDAHGILERRVEAAEKSLANIQGRLWAITVGLTAITIVTDIALRLLGH